MGYTCCARDLHKFVSLNRPCSPVDFLVLAFRPETTVGPIFTLDTTVNSLNANWSLAMLELHKTSECHKNENGPEAEDKITYRWRYTSVCVCVEQSAVLAARPQTNSNHFLLKLKMSCPGYRFVQLRASHHVTPLLC